MKAIALVEWNWTGHHPTYFTHFVLALEQLGIRVLALCPDPEEAASTVSRLRQTLGQSAGRFPPEFRQMPQMRNRSFPRRRLRVIDRKTRLFQSAEKAILKWKLKHNIGAIETFYSCIYDWEFKYFKYARPLLQLRWSGLYIRLTQFQGPKLAPNRRVLSPYIECIFRDKNLNAIAILEEGSCNSLAERVRRRVVVFPDLTDERMPAFATELALANCLRAFAGDRPVVGLFGHLQHRKGLTTFCSVTQSPAVAHLCFALGGTVDWHEFSPTERNLIKTSVASRQNIWTHFARIPDGPCLNATLASCTLLFAAYSNFPHSSNLLTKAAILQKPVIVSEGSLMAERVRKFNLGEVVPEGGVDATVEAVLRITRDPFAWVTEHRPDWQAYRERHSFAALKIAFSELLSES